jgi:hypothetical protein
MEKQQSTAEGRSLATGWCIVISFLLGGHFLGVILAPVALPISQYPAPQLASALHQPTAPWLNATLLNQPWRFFAPEPGPISLELFRVEREDGSATWDEFPNSSRLKWRAPALQRGLAMAMRLEAELRPKASRPQTLELSPDGLILAGSYARHMARCAEGQGKPARSIQIWVLHHYPRTPDQVRSGWLSDDLRLWSACEIGEFSPKGVLIDTEASPHSVSIPKLAALWIADRRTGPPSEDQIPAIFDTQIVKHRIEDGDTQSEDQIAAKLTWALQSGDTPSLRIRQPGGSP